MSEISLVKQLSGPECLDSMLSELRKKLRMNGRFQSHMAYPGYRAVLHLEFYPAASYIPSAEQTVEVENIPTAPDQTPKSVLVSDTPTVDEKVEIPVRSPNQVREDSEMPTPVLTQDAQGNPVEKWIKKPGRPPKNKYKGGSVAEGTEPLVTMVPTTIPVER
jgi:hypothetical protein